MLLVFGVQWQIILNRRIFVYWLVQHRLLIDWKSNLPGAICEEAFITHAHHHGYAWQDCSISNAVLERLQ